MEGWIKLSRELRNHWIWSDSEYLKAWIGILLTVNFEAKKAIIKHDLVDCDRGQSVLSLQSWAKLFGKKWTIQRVRTFFKLLQDDQMITIEGLKYSTRLTVCKYDTYQDIQQTDNKLITFSQQTENKLITTTKEVKNVKKENNDKEEIFIAKIKILTERKNVFFKSLIPFVEEFTKDTVREFYNYWTEPNKSQTKLRYELEKTWDTNLRLHNWRNRSDKMNKSKQEQKPETYQVTYK